MSEACFGFQALFSQESRRRSKIPLAPVSAFTIYINSTYKIYPRVKSGKHPSFIKKSKDFLSEENKNRNFFLLIKLSKLIVFIHVILHTYLKEIESYQSFVVKSVKAVSQHLVEHLIIRFFNEFKLI